MIPRRIILDLDEQEVAAAISLFNDATRFRGLEVAENAVLLAKKYTAQASEGEQVKILESLMPKPAEQPKK